MIDNPYLKNAYYNGVRSAQLAKLSRGEGFLHAIGAQPGYEIGAPYIDQGLAKAGGSWSDFAYWITTFYGEGDWGHQVGDDPYGNITVERRAVQDGIVAAQDFDAAFDITCSYRGRASTSIEVIKGQMAESKANADARGLKLVGYEGNVTSFLSGGDPAFGTRDPFYTAMTNHPLAAPVTRAVLDAANEVGMVEAMFFTSDGAPPNSNDGNYAALGRPSVEGIVSFTTRPVAASTTAPPTSAAQPSATTPLTISGTGYSFDTTVKKFGAAELSLDGSAGWSITGGETASKRVVLGRAVDAVLRREARHCDHAGVLFLAGAGERQHRGLLRHWLRGCAPRLDSQVRRRCLALRRA